MMFQSTRPVRGATGRYGKDFLSKLVSIHAPRAGRDSLLRTIPRNAECFNPRAPCGARPSSTFILGYHKLVSIHAPRAGRDSEEADKLLTKEEVSIHAPRAGRDGRTVPTAASSRSFNPRAPCGARPKSHAYANNSILFQSTRPVRGATWCVGFGVRWLKGFNPRAPCGARHHL